MTHRTAPFPSASVCLDAFVAACFAPAAQAQFVPLREKLQANAVASCRRRAITRAALWRPRRRRAERDRSPAASRYCQRFNTAAGRRQGVQQRNATRSCHE